MSHLGAAELPAPLGDSKSKDERQEEDPFSDEHHIPPEEDLYSAESPYESGYASLSQPAELPALAKQRANLLASLQLKSPTSDSRKPEAASNSSNPSHPAEPQEAARSREPQHDAPDRARSAMPTATPFADARPARERVPPEFYSPPLLPRIGHGLPIATDVEGRYILKKAVSRAALQLAGIAFTEGDDDVLLHIDPGPIALRDLRVASVAMQHPAEWWRLEGPDDPAYPHQPGRSVEAPAPERRDARFRTLIAPWKRRNRDTQAGPSGLGAAGSSRTTNARPHTGPISGDESDSEEDRPAKHLYR